MTIPIKAIMDQLADVFIGADAKVNTRPIWPVSEAGDKAELKGLTAAQRTWLRAMDFRPRAGNWALLPGNGGIGGVVLGLGEDHGADGHALLPGVLPAVLPEGDYHFARTPRDPELASLAWALGAYAFQRYMTGAETIPRRLKLPAGVDRDAVLHVARAVWLGRELINMPANDLGPAEIEDAVRHLAEPHGAYVKVTEGSRLLTDNFPLIHTVGRASDRAPRLIDLTWGDKTAPKVTLVGKGICFDTGGLNIKPGTAMALMKKDMGGAATAIALAAMVMAARLPVRLRLLVPAADNAISGSAFRPGDIIRSRSGLTVEIANTDAEGRLVMADALSLADEEQPELLVSLATLTGAARVALGPDLPPFYTDNDDLSEDLMAAAGRVGDPAWRLPFWMPYDTYLRSKVADVNHVFTGPFAGSITAALFLKRFVRQARDFVHLDIYAWIPRTQPAKPQGGEPQTARALFALLKTRYGRHE